MCKLISEQSTIIVNVKKRGNFYILTYNHYDTNTLLNAPYFMVTNLMEEYFSIERLNKVKFCADTINIRQQSYKLFFMLKSTEHEISTTYKS